METFKKKMTEMDRDLKQKTEEAEEGEPRKLGQSESDGAPVDVRLAAGGAVVGAGGGAEVVHLDTGGAKPPQVSGPVVHIGANIKDAGPEA